MDVGGIKAVVTDANNRPVELEGGEVIINKEASKKHWKELSRINQSAGNGVPIDKPIDPHDEDPQEFAKGGKIEFNPNKLPNKWILSYAKNIKENHPEIWKLGGNIYGNKAFENLLRVSERGYWLDSEEWFYLKWRSFVARHKGNFQIAGVVAMLKWVDKVDKGWQYMKNLIEDEITKIDSKKEKGGVITWKDKYNKKYGYDETTSHNLNEISKDTGVSLKGIQQIYNKGIGAFKTNPESVRPNVKSKEQWAMARVYSSVMGGDASKVDAQELKMAKGGLTTNKTKVIIAKTQTTFDKKEYGGIIEIGLKGWYKGKQLMPITVTKTNKKNIYFRNENTGEIKRSERKNFERLFDSTTAIDSNIQKNYDIDTPAPTTKAPRKKAPAKKVVAPQTDLQKQPQTQNTKFEYYELYKSKNAPIELSNNEFLSIQFKNFLKMVGHDKVGNLRDYVGFSEAIDNLS